MTNTAPQSEEQGANDWKLTKFIDRLLRLLAALALLVAAIEPAADWLMPDWKDRLDDTGGAIRGLFSQECRRLADLQRTANSGYDALAMTEIAFSSEIGQCAKRDPEKAFDLYKQAADRNHTWAKLKVGEFLLAGTAGVHDPKQALEYLTAAADAGEARAITLIGTIYENGDLNHGKTTAVDTTKAITFYKKAIALNEPRSFADYGALYKRGFGPIQKDCKEAMKLYERGAQLGDDRSLTLIGDIYDTGCPPFAQNAATAMDWFEKGAKAGDPRAAILINSHGGKWPPEEKRTFNASRFMLPLIAVVIAAILWFGRFPLASLIKRKRQLQVGN